ncbi:metabotropic glutamate receptor 3-like [Glandiceps talaboti]
MAKNSISLGEFSVMIIVLFYNFPACKCRYARDGDIILGGLFPLHDYDHTIAQCGQKLGLESLKMVEAMVYAIENVNNNDTLLPNVTLGFEIYDTCQNPAVTLEYALNFTPSQRAFICNNAFNCSRCQTSFGYQDGEFCTKLITGVVGPRRSTCSVQATTLLGLSWIPEISYLATDDDLSNKNKYPFFLRTVPPSRYQAQAMIDILVRFNWTFVSAIHSDDSYGQNGVVVFERLADRYSICIATTMSLSSQENPSYYDDVIRILRRNSNASVVIVFAQVEHVQYLMSAVKRNGAIGEFIWLASDGWANYGLDIIKGYEEAALGALLLKQFALPVPDFEEYIYSKSPVEIDNPWMMEFVEERKECLTLSENFTKCFQNATDDIHHESLVVDAVLAFANSIHTIFQNQCGSTWSTYCRGVINAGYPLLNTLLSESFEGVNGIFEFNENGEVSARYFVDQIQRSNESDYGIVTVGTWNALNDSLDDHGQLYVTDKVQWCNGTICAVYRETGLLPESVCSKPCEFGHAMVKSLEVDCCWMCIHCQSWQIIVDNGSRCLSCSEVDEYSWPNDDKTECEPIPPTYLHVSESVGILFATLATIGIGLAAATAVFYVLHNDHILIKASSRELSYIILAGVVISYIHTFFFMLKPSTVVCTCRRWLGFGMTMIYATLMTKTNRVYRIFKNGRKSAERPKFISPRSQIVITSLLISVQIVVTTTAIIINPPSTVLEMPDQTRNYVELTCEEPYVAMIIIICYLAILVIICAYGAFKTRRLPNNYNESKFITFDVFTTLVVLLACLPSYILTRSAVMESIYVIMGTLIQASVNLTCLFFPKIFAVYFVAEDDLHVGSWLSFRTSLRSKIKGGELSSIPTNCTTKCGDQQVAVSCCHCKKQDETVITEQKLQERKTDDQVSAEKQFDTTDSDI